MEERAYQYWLHNLPGVGDRRIEKLLKVFGSAKEIYNAGAKTLEKVLGEKAGEKIVDFTRCWDVEKSYEKLISKNILFPNSHMNVLPCFINLIKRFLL